MAAGPVSRLIVVPSIITLVLTLIRLTGELFHGPEILFNCSAGGGAAPLGISWLAFVFAAYFAVRLQSAGDAPAGAGKAIGLTILSLLFVIAGNLLLFPVGQGKGSSAAFISGMAVVIAGLYVMRAGWPGYWKAMLGYAVAARVPVIVVMLFAIRGNWGTHYDAPPHTMDILWTSWFNKWVDIGLLPQLFFWTPYTVVFCGLFGVIVAALRKRRAAAAAVSAG